MNEIVKHINDTNASYRNTHAGDAKNTDLFLDNEHYEMFKDVGEQVTVRFSKENLSQAILFIASILPRKYDNSAVHKVVSYSAHFIREQLNMLDGFFMEADHPVKVKTQKWTVRKDVSKKNGEIDNRFYFNGLLKEYSYFDIEGKLQRTKFTIRDYLAGGYSSIHIKKSSDNIFDITVVNTTEAYCDNNNLEVLETTQVLSNVPCQQIFYGAPGTGKSFKINQKIKGKDAIRTTFHPDSDYSSFVGAYKPTTREITMRDLSGHPIVEHGQTLTEEKIVYEFVPQAFLQAYIAAWEKYAACDEGNPQQQFLVIEEINRGNCAQIFGDLFQLLDRNHSGFSDYPVKADTDMKRYVAKALKGLTIPQAGAINSLYGSRDVVSEVLEGNILLLPSNLFIWATMNTSDQSLFPIDSAFKRRWEWEYVPIRNAIRNEEQDWVIAADGKEWDWWQFLEAVNEKIASVTDSEDKKLGYFFVKPADGHTITAKTFVGKVLFYLWNDVFKDYGFSDDEFQTKEGKEIRYPMFYETAVAGQEVNEGLIAQFLNKLLPKPEETDEATNTTTQEEA